MSLRPGGRFAAQCGGAGNIARLRKISKDVAATEPFAPHFEGFEEPWNYAGAEETESQLRAAGFAEVRCWLQPWTIEPPQPAEFIRTVCLGHQVDRLPAELRDPFVEAVVAAEPVPLRMEYVRLNIEAVAAA